MEYTPQNVEQEAIKLLKEIATKDKLLTFGYIRNCFKLKEFQNITYLSNDLCVLISSFVDSSGDIHLFAGNSKEHWKIKLNELFGLR